LDTAAIRSRLERMLADLDSTARTLEAEGAGDTSSELSHLDQHPADEASQVADRQVEAAVLGTVAGQRAAVTEALRRLDAGSYGVCVDCGRPIPEGRLAARPEAVRCVEDQAKHEAAVGTDARGG
jgi:DnaK suppressor protein